MKGNKKEQNRRICVYFIYGIALFYLIFKAFFYYAEVDWGPDARAHMSYIYYEYSHPGELIPQFENMQMVDFQVVGDKAYILGLSQDVCYLGHPPLYYMLMNYVGCVQTDAGATYIDTYRVLIVNIFLVALGLAMCMEVGRRKIEALSNSLVSHALFATITVSLPMVSYVGSGASNDNILYLAVGILLIGLERGVAGKRDYLTYWIIAIGVAVAVMSKLTLGLITLVALAVIVIYLMMSEKSGKVLWCKEFAVTLPVYLTVLGYFLAMLGKYSDVQPSLRNLSPESFANSEFAVGNDLNMSFGEAIAYFWEHFWWSWSTIYSHTVSIDKNATVSEAIYWLIPLGAIVLLGVLIFLLIRKRDAKRLIVMGAFVVGAIVAFLYQMLKACRGYVAGGRLGGVQARYYICGIGVYALCNVMVLEQIILCCEKKQIVKKCIWLIEALLIIGYLYNDFYYFLTNFTEYRAYL